MKAWSKFKNKYSSRIGHALIQAHQDDQFIAAYPRSGSTWLRTIIVNILEPEAKGDPDYFNNLIPAVSIRNSRYINHLSSPRLIMTHSEWRMGIDKAVYLLRDGRDSFISSYHYHVTRRQKKISLEQFFDLYRQQVYGNMWHQNVNSWLNHGRATMGQNLYILRFEDLKNNAATEVARVCEFLKIECSDSQIQAALKYATIKNAKNIEQAKQGPLESNDHSFYRSGDVKQRVASSDQYVVHEFEKLSAETLALAGY